MSMDHLPRWKFWWDLAGFSASIFLHKPTCLPHIHCCFPNGKQGEWAWHLWRMKKKKKTAWLLALRDYWGRAMIDLYCANCERLWLQVCLDNCHSKRLTAQTCPPLANVSTYSCKHAQNFNDCHFRCLHSRLHVVQGRSVKPIYGWAIVIKHTRNTCYR